MKRIKLTVIDYDSDIALFHKTIEIEDTGFIREHVQRWLGEDQYKINKIESKKDRLWVYVTPFHHGF